MANIETKDSNILQTLREDVIKYRDDEANDFDFEVRAINGVVAIIDKLIAEKDITVLKILREDVIKYRDDKSNDFVDFEVGAINGIIHKIDKLIAESEKK
jgi:hypothetical protein